MGKIILSTTNTIQGFDIERYIDLVFSNVVIGTNIFSDIGASFTDFFGGTSDIYKGKLSKMRKMAIAEVKAKASNIGANAIIGLKIDFDEISGKGKSMFMISVTGTAVKVIQKDGSEKDDRGDDSVISSEELENELDKKRVLLQLENQELPTEAQWDTILSSPDYEIAIKLFPFYLSHLDYVDVDKDKLLIANYYKLIKRIDPDLIVNFLYENLLSKEHKHYEKIARIIYDNRFFKPDKIKELIEKGLVKEAIICLSSTKELYSQGDFNLMNQILTLIEELPNTGVIESIKSGLMAKEKERYICEHGHKNNVDIEFCQTCKINIKGLDSIEMKRINSFKKRVESIEYLFKNSRL